MKILGCLCVTALALGCRGDAKPTRGLPPSDQWDAPAQGTAGTAPAAGPSGRPENAVSTDESARFTACLLAHVRADPVATSRAIGLFARAAPAPVARSVTLAIAAAMESAPADVRAKVLGEAAWTLAGIASTDDARALARQGAALPLDPNGGRLTALAALGRTGAVAEAEVLAGDALARDAIAYGAAIGGHREEAARMRRELEAGPTGASLARSPIHLKVIAAMGDVSALSTALEDRSAPDLLLNADAVVEAGAVARDQAVMMIGVVALREARGVPPAMQAQALCKAAGTAAGARARPVLDAAVVAFDAMSPEARVGLEVIPALAYATSGDLPEARRRFELVQERLSPAEREAVAIRLAVAGHRWQELPASIPPSALMVADVWGQVLASKADAAARARVLAAICP